MSLEELINLQKEFDGKHSGRFEWDSKITDSNIEMLEFLLVSLTGEVGEFANIVKKIARGDFELEEVKDNLREELTDIFIYLMKLSYQLDIDLEESYLNKKKKNEERFTSYEKDNTKEDAD